MDLSMYTQGRLRYLHQLLLFFAVIGVSLATDSCPSVCTCDVQAQLVDCSNQNLTQIPAALPAWVTTLILQNNQLREIESEAFHHLPILKILDLRDNQIETIASDAFLPNTHLQIIKLARNPLQCGCDLVDLGTHRQTVLLQGARCANLGNQSLHEAIQQLACAHLASFSFKTKFKLVMHMYIEWNQNYADATSKRYEELSLLVKQEIENVLNDTDFPRSTCILALNKYIPFLKNGVAFTEARASIECTLPTETSPATVRDAIYIRLDEADLNRKLAFDIDFSRLSLIGDGFCAGIKEQMSIGLVRWPSALPDNVSAIPCPENPAQNATKKCAKQGQTPIWANKNISLCEEPSDRTKKLEDLSLRRVYNETIEEITEELVNLTGDISNYTSREVSLVSNIIRNTLAAPVPVDQDIAGNLLSSVNQMMSVAMDTLVHAELHTGAPQKLVQSVERLGSEVQTTQEGVKVVQPQVAMLVVSPPSVGGLLFETRGDIQDDLTEDRMTVQQSPGGLPDPSAVVAAVSLPPSAVQRGGQGANVQFDIYNSDSFFKAAELANQRRARGVVEQKAGAFLLNSRVVSAKVGTAPLEGLKDPVTVILRHLVQNSSEHKCVYWDFSQGGWSDRGCDVTEERPGYTTCRCNHLTNFALLMDIYGTAGDLPEVHKTVLSFISYIGCAVSTIGLLLTLTTYFTFRKMLRDNPSKILVNLAIALLSVIVTFVFATQVFVRDNYVACKVMAALTHYAILASMAWMSVEAFYMYVAIVRVFHSYYSKFIIKCALFGWGVPLIVIAITMGINKDNYGQQGEICWLARIPFFVAVLVPVSVVLVLNCIAFGLVIYQLRQMDSRRIDLTKRSDILARLRGAISIMVLLGLTWIFAFFAIGGAGVVFHYLFAIFNSLQGLFIFIFYCALKKEAQMAWLHCLGCEAYNRSSPSTSKETISFSSRDRSDIKSKSNSIAPGTPTTSVAGTPPTGHRPRRAFGVDSPITGQSNKSVVTSAGKNRTFIRQI